MLQFNHNGFLTPPSIIQSTVSELEMEFVKNIPSHNRKLIFENYLNYSDALKAASKGKAFVQWVNGSFTTKKAEPGDIDIVSFVDYTLINNEAKLFAQFIYPNSETNFDVDGYIVPVYPHSHKLHFLYTSDRLDWLDRFNKTWLTRAGNRHPKGFLEIIY